MGRESDESIDKNGGADRRSGEAINDEWSEAPLEPDESLSQPESVRALEIAASYLDDVEAVLWQTANRTSHEPLGEELREVSEQLWRLQNELDAAIESGRAELTVETDEWEAIDEPAIEEKSETPE